MYTQSLPGADWLQPAGTDCTACSGSQVRQLTLSSKVLDLNDAFNTYNAQEQVLGDFLEAQKALFFAITTEGIKAELTTYKANLEQRIFEEVFGPDFYEIMCEAKWLKGKKLEKVLLSMKDKALSVFGIAEEINGHQTKTAVDLYQWIEKTIGEIRALLSAIRKLTFKLPPESYAAVYEKQSKHIDMESILNFYNDKILNVGKLSFKNYLAFSTRAVADFINKGVLRFAFKPTTEEIAEVDFERVRRHLPPDYEFKDFFIQHCAIFKKMAAWKGRTLVIDTKSYGKYMCLHKSKLTPEELLEFYKLEKLVAMINEAIRNLPPDEESEEKAMAADDDYFVEKLGEALNEVEAYMWGQSAHAVLFCALRDHHGFTDNMSRYERIHEKLSEKRNLRWPCPKGTLRVAFGNNSYYKVSVTRWKDMDVPQRALALLDKFEAIFD